MSRIAFTPTLLLEPGRPQPPIAVKGRVPHGDYAFALLNLYPEVPSLSLIDAYARIVAQLQRADEILAHRLKLRALIALQVTRAPSEAGAMLAALFDPHRPGAGQVIVPDAAPGKSLPELFDLEQPRPFPLKIAGHVKLLHTMAWVDSNIKVQAENIAENHAIAASDAAALVEIAMTVFCLLVKMQDYRLAVSMNFNHSMFLQDRILNVVFGDSLYFGAGRTAPPEILRTGMLSNQMALELLRGLGDLTPRRLCTLGIFMGVLWTSRPDVQQDFQNAHEDALGRLESELKRVTGRMAIDHVDRLLAWLGVDRAESVVVVLDDNGESVFDLALFQSILTQTTRLRVEFVVNRYPVSNNIALDTLETLLVDPWFRELRRMRDDGAGRVSVCIEEQAFRSFEESYLSPATRSSLRRCAGAYIKGANFFETFQPDYLPRYYCFTVSGVTGQMLTGCAAGDGICAELPAGVQGYVYQGPADVRSLREIVGHESPDAGGPA